MSGSNIKDYYYILGLAPDASKNEIKIAYRKLSIKLHPDQNSGDKFFEERFKDLNEAYETLSDDTKRKIYDDRLRTGGYTSGKNYSNTQSQSSRSTGSPASTPTKKRNKERLYTILGSIILIGTLIKIVVNIINTKEKVEDYKNISTLLHDTTTNDTNNKTHNIADDSVILLRMYYDTPVSLPPVTTVTDRDPPNPIPDSRNNEQLKYKDDDGLTAEDAVNYFFNAFNNNDCNKAWNMSYNNYWVKQGEGWFCSSKAFGGVKKVLLRKIYMVTQTDKTAEVYVDYYAEDIYNGNKCFKQNIVIQKILYSDNKYRWRIIKMKNNEQPVDCDVNQ